MLKDTGAMSLQIVPNPTQISENHTAKALKMQAALASEIQTEYFNGMDLTSCNTHMKTCSSEECSESNYNNNVPLHNALNMLEEANLTVRVNHLNHGVDSQASCAEVTNDNLKEMLSTGATQVQSPGGIFELQSHNNNTITSIKFFSN